MARMVRKQINIEERQVEILKTWMRRTGRSESDLIRQAIDDAYDPETADARRREAYEAWKRGREEARARSRAAGIEPAWPGRDALYDPPRGMPKKAE